MVCTGDADVTQPGHTFGGYSAIFYSRFELKSRLWSVFALLDGPVFVMQTVHYKWLVGFHVIVTENGIRTHAATMAIRNAVAGARHDR